MKKPDSELIHELMDVYLSSLESDADDFEDFDDDLFV